MAPVNFARIFHSLPYGRGLAHCAPGTRSFSGSQTSIQPKAGAL
jgi:hypothetical protein